MDLFSYFAEVLSINLPDSLFFTLVSLQIKLGNYATREESFRFLIEWSRL